MPDDLNISLAELGLRTVGRAKQPLTATFAGELTLEELEEKSQTEGRAPPRQLVRLRQRHHMIARMLASGVDDGTIAVTARITAGRLSTLKSDPAMQELIQHYQGIRDEEFREAQELASGLAVDALDEIRERLETNPDEFSLSMLVKVAEFTMDRTGDGPTTTKNIDVRVGLADKLDQARKRVERLRRERSSHDIIDITPEKESPSCL